ncbi:hypothetical protein ACSNN7_27120 [Micromonospora sp. URMC 105]|uniref:hypothetical protein n=1 Tax=Micromonospora sp. URMC 105 TaxID=3423413 RepID=UPI003F1DCF7A
MTHDAAAPARPPRPTAVTVAYWLQIAAVVVLLALVGLVLWHAVEWNGEIDRAARLVPDADPAEVSDERFGNIFMSSVIGVAALLLALWFALTARGVRRGSNVARILVFVAGGLQALVCCAQGGFALLFIPFFFAIGGPEEEWEGEEIPAEFMPEESKFLETLYGTGSDPTGEVLFTVGGVGATLVLGLTAAAVVLLVLPPVHRWFVPRAATPDAPRPPLHPPYPPAFLLPPGYMLCPDPRAHGLPPHPAAASPHPAAAPQQSAAASPEPAAAPQESAAASPQPDAAPATQVTPAAPPPAPDAGQSPPS